MLVSTPLTNRTVAHRYPQERITPRPKTWCRTRSPLTKGKAIRDPRPSRPPSGRAGSRRASKRPRRTACAARAPCQDCHAPPRPCPRGSSGRAHGCRSPPASNRGCRSRRSHPRTNGAPCRRRPRRAGQQRRC
jgi:hypothetical protein